MTETLNQNATNTLYNVSEEYVFRCCDGRILRSLRELGDALNTMSGDTYAFHANTDKNDFTNWVRDIIRDEKLAKNLQKAPNQVQAAKHVASRVAILSKRFTSRH